jgi:predicted peptidase
MRRFLKGLGFKEGSLFGKGTPSRQYAYRSKGSLNYLLFLPDGYGKKRDEKWPLILYLHGIGERGVKLKALKKHGIPKIVDVMVDFPFITASPQCPDDTFWWDHLEALRGLIDEILSSHPIDSDRIYLTGNSMGGYGAWRVAMEFPELFAAIAPICGGGDPTKVYVLKEVPVWAFHGARDDVVDPKESEKMVNALRACGGNAKLTLYPDVGHDSWTQTYESPDLFHWFLQNTR